MKKGEDRVLPLLNRVSVWSSFAQFPATADRW
jgi:hypothetical protein